MHEGTILEWLRSPGAYVAEGDDLVQVDIEKTEVVLPMPFTGTLVRILVDEGDSIEVFTPIAVAEEA